MNSDKFPTLYEEHSKDAAYFGDRADWLIVFSRNRDSYLLDRSNWETFVSALDHIDPDGLSHAIERSSHWLCGWVEYLIVRPTHSYETLLAELEAVSEKLGELCEGPPDEREQLAKAAEEIGQELADIREVYTLSKQLLAKARELVDALERYPVLDEEDYLRRQWDAYLNNWEAYWRLEFVDELPSEDADRLIGDREGRAAAEFALEYFEFLLDSGESYDHEGFPSFRLALAEHSPDALDVFLSRKPNTQPQN
jgi:hypothetical protein